MAPTRDEGDDREFHTPERTFPVTTTGSPRGDLLIVSCRSGAELGARLLAQYRASLAERRSRQTVSHLERIDFQFSDTETCVRLEQHVAGCDAFLVQALLDPASGRSVDENLMALVLAADTLREWGAHHVTAVVPYLAYGRQDKPTRDEREPTTARFVADMMLRSGIDRLVTWHPHSAHVKGFHAGVRVDVLDALHLFEEAFDRFRGCNDVVVVAPDIGASAIATRLARSLGVHVAIAAKVRPRAEEAVTTAVIGDLTAKRIAIVIDDMLGTGGTVDGLIRRLVAEHGIEEVVLGVSHNLCLPVGTERLVDLHERHRLTEVVVTNSVPQTPGVARLPFVRIRDLSHTLARVINRIHFDRSVSALFRPPAAKPLPRPG